MRLKTIEEAKKYLNKIIYLLNEEKNNPVKLYIGGINLYYNQVSYDVVSFYAFCNEKMTDAWGDIKFEDIKDNFDKNDFRHNFKYTFSKELAENTLPIYKKYRKNINKECAIENAKRLLDEENIKYEIFE